MLICTIFKGFGWCSFAPFFGSCGVWVCLAASSLRVCSWLEGLLHEIAPPLKWLHHHKGCAAGWWCGFTTRCTSIKSFGWCSFAPFLVVWLVLNCTIFVVVWLVLICTIFVVVCVRFWGLCFVWVLGGHRVFCFLGLTRIGIFCLLEGLRSAKTLT